jgi:hypothetical protein
LKPKFIGDGRDAGWRVGQLATGFEEQAFLRGFKGAAASNTLAQPVQTGRRDPQCRGVASYGPMFLIVLFDGRPEAGVECEIPLAGLIGHAMLGLAPR